MHVPSLNINFSTVVRQSTEELRKPMTRIPAAPALVSQEPVKHFTLRELIAMHPFGKEVDPHAEKRLSFVG